MDIVFMIIAGFVGFFLTLYLIVCKFLECCLIQCFREPEGGKVQVSE